MTNGTEEQAGTADKVVIRGEYDGGGNWEQRLRAWNDNADLSFALSFVHDVFSYDRLDSRRPLEFVLAIIEDRDRRDGQGMEEGRQKVAAKATQVFVREFLVGDARPASRPRWQYVLDKNPDLLVPVLEAVIRHRLVGMYLERPLGLYEPYRSGVEKFLNGLLACRGSDEDGCQDLGVIIAANTVLLMRAFIEYGLDGNFHKLEDEADIAALKALATGTGTHDPNSLGLALRLSEHCGAFYRRRAAEHYLLHAARRAVREGRTTLDLDNC